MTQRTWSTTDVSAYLDGQLEPKRQAALETDMEHNIALRQRVDAMRQVVSLMRAEPLRQPPRNYLLTPAMVAEAKPRAARTTAGPRRRMSLMGLRLSTALVTLAFVVTFGLTALQGNMMPAMRTGAAEAPEGAMLAQGEEAVEQANDQAGPEEPEGAPRVMAVPDESEEKLYQEEAPSEDAAVPMPEAGVALAPEPEVAPAEGESEATDSVTEEGATPEPEMSAMALEAPAVEGTPLPPESSDEAPAEPPAEEAVPESETALLQRAPERTEDAAVQGDVQDEDVNSAPGGEVLEEFNAGGSDRGNTSVDPGSDNVMAQEAGNGTLLAWISRGLGIAALVLAAITLWLTYQPLSRRK